MGEITREHSAPFIAGNALNGARNDLKGKGFESEVNVAHILTLSRDGVSRNYNDNAHKCIQKL